MARRGRLTLQGSIDYLLKLVGYGCIIVLVVGVLTLRPNEGSEAHRSEPLLALWMGGAGAALCALLLYLRSRPRPAPAVRIDVPRGRPEDPRDRPSELLRPGEDNAATPGRGAAYGWERGTLVLALMACMSAWVTWTGMDPAVSANTVLSQYPGTLKSYQAPPVWSRPPRPADIEFLGVFGADGMLRVRVDCAKLAINCAAFREGTRTGTLLVAHETRDEALGVEIRNATGAILLPRERQIAYLHAPRERQRPVLWASVGSAALFCAIHLWLRRRRLTAARATPQFFSR